MLQQTSAIGTTDIVALEFIPLKNDGIHSVEI